MWRRWGSLLRPRGMRALALATAGASLLVSPSWAALPPGRAWTGIDTLKLNGHAYMVPGRFEPPTGGKIELIANGYYGPTVPAGSTHRTYGLVWADSVWRIRWSLDDQAYWMRPALTPPDRQLLVWKSTDVPDPTPPPMGYIIAADVVGDTVSPRDTIVRVRPEVLVPSGTSGGARRWVAIRDIDPAKGYLLRIFRSDTRGRWRETGPTGLTGERHMDIAAVDSATVLVVTGEGNRGVRWGYLRDTTFVEESPPLSVDRVSTGPSLRPRPSGGFWCAWTANMGVPDWTDIIEIRGFRDGAWSAPETLRIRKPNEFQQLFYQAELGADGGEVPAVAWFGYSPVSGDAADYIWTSFPTDAGPGVGERFEGSWNGINPTLVRDENGDVWLAWWRMFDGIYWAHTYTTANPSAASLTNHDGRPLVRWSLDRSAPETWWAVMRGEGDAPLVRVARIRAGTDTVMTWADTSAPAGTPLRYAIRRECRDIRYQRTGPEARWEPRGPMLALIPRGANPTIVRVEFDVMGADAGPLDVKLFDLLGREVVRARLLAAGSGQDAASVEIPSRVRAGLYFLRVTAADGRQAPTTKIAVVR